MSVKMNNISSDSLLVIDTECDLYQQTTFSLPPHCLQEAQNGNDLVTLGYVNSLVGQYSGGFNLFFNYSVTDGIYKSLGQSVVDSVTQQIVPITTDTTNQLVAKFVSPALGITTIPSGIWNMLIYSEVAANGGTLTYFFEVYTLTGATETLLFTSALSADVNANTTPAGFNVNGTLLSPAPIALTDKVVIKIYLHKDGTPLLVNTYFQYDYYSFIQSTLNAGTTLLASNNTFTGTNNFTLSPTVPTASYASNLNVANTTYVASNFVNNSANQTIAGKKTFTTGIATDTISATTSLTILNDTLDTTPITIGNGLSSTGTITLGRLTRQLNVYGASNSSIEMAGSGTITVSNLVSSSLDFLFTNGTANLYNSFINGIVNIGPSMTSSGSIKLGGIATPVKISNVDIVGNNVTLSAGTLKCPTIVGFSTLSIGTGTTTGVTLGLAAQTTAIRGSASSSIDIVTGTIGCGNITAPSLDSATTLDLGQTTATTTKLGRTGGITNIYGTSSSSIAIGSGTIGCGVITSSGISTDTIDSASAIINLYNTLTTGTINLGKNLTSGAVNINTTTSSLNTNIGSLQIVGNQFNSANGTTPFFIGQSSSTGNIVIGRSQTSGNITLGDGPSRTGVITIANSAGTLLSPSEGSVNIASGTGVAGSYTTTVNIATGTTTGAVSIGNTATPISINAATGSLVLGAATISCAAITTSADITLKTTGAAPTQFTKLGGTTSATILATAPVNGSIYGSIAITTAGVYLFCFSITQVYTVLGTSRFVYMTGTNSSTSPTTFYGASTISPTQYGFNGSQVINCTASTYTLTLGLFGGGVTGIPTGGYFTATRIG